MKFEDYSPEIQAKLMEIGNVAADAVDSQESPAEGIPEDSPNFSPELELNRLHNRCKTELEYIDARIAQMVLPMHERGQSWETIGRELGITGEDTRLRYAELERPRQ